MPVKFEKPPALEIAEGGAGNARWTTPKTLVPQSPYTIDGLRAKPASAASCDDVDMSIDAANRTVSALLDSDIQIPRKVDVRMPGTPTAVRVTVTRGGSKRRPDVNSAGVELVARWNRRRSLAAREDGEFTLLDDLRRQFMANEDESGDNWDLYSDSNLLMRESLKFDPRVRAVLWQIWVRLMPSARGAPLASLSVIMSVRRTDSGCVFCAGAL